VENAERDPNSGFTGIGEAIDFGLRLIAENAYDGRQLKIDVSGDGHNNTGVPLSKPRRAADALEIVINGLPILTHSVDFFGRIPMQANVDYYDLETYYREEVILGSGAFVEIANDYGDFARAFLRKLRRELTPLVSQDNGAPRGRTTGADSKYPCRSAECPLRVWRGPGDELATLLPSPLAPHVEMAPNPERQRVRRVDL
jgi:hypothetical protein